MDIQVHLFPVGRWIYVLDMAKRSKMEVWISDKQRDYRVDVDA